MKTKRMQEAARAELVMLNSLAVLASSTAPFRSLRSFLSRTCGQEGGQGRRWASAQETPGPGPGLCLHGNPVPPLSTGPLWNTKVDLVEC